MFSALREFTLDAWDWLLRKKYPRQKQLESLRERSQPFPASPDLKELHSEIGSDLKAETKLVQSEIGSGLKAETRLVQKCNSGPVLVRQPSLAGLWEQEKAAYYAHVLEEF